MLYESNPISPVLDGWTTNDLVFLWKEGDPVQVVKNLHLPRFTLEKFLTDYCNSKTNTGTYVQNVCVSQCSFLGPIFATSILYIMLLTIFPVLTYIIRTRLVSFPRCVAYFVCICNKCSLEIACQVV